MLIHAKADGVLTELDVPVNNFAVCVHDQAIKVEVPGAVTIGPKETAKCMEEMSQAAWVHITTGPLFTELFGELFKDRPVKLPTTVKALLEDYDEGVIHACGLIILLCEAMFERKSKVFVKTPEASLHPAVCYRLMTVLMKIMRMGGINDVLTTDKEQP